MDAQPVSQLSTWLNVGSVKHGYPPPRLSAGAITIAYCGAELVVEGAVSDRPPRDACPLCALAWQNGKRPGRRWARAFRGPGARGGQQSPDLGARDDQEPDSGLT